MGFVVYLEHHPFVFTSPPVTTSTATTLAVAARLADPPPATVATELAMPLEQLHAAAPKRTPKTAASEGKELSPCTGWREVGATYLVDGRSGQTRAVRGLCEER